LLKYITWQKSKLILCLAIFVSPWIVFSQTGYEQDEPVLPLKIFKTLEAGKAQTVIVYGTSVTIRGQWANEMDNYFENHYPGQVTFINAAKSGMHSNWGVENLQERVLDKHPDLVFIEFAINDAASKHGISTADCRRNLDMMVKALQQQNLQMEIVLQTMNPAWDSPAVPKSFASDRPHLEEYYDVYRSYAQMNNLALVDNYPVWKKIMDQEPQRYKKMVPDGIHPDSSSSAEIAWPQIKALLDRARAFAAGTLTINVWPEGKMPGKGADSPEALVTPEKTDAIRITNVSQPILTLYPAANQDGPVPVMIICPGGSYSYVVVDKEGSEIAKWLNSIGISALVLKYRVPGNKEGALQDIQRALRITRNHAKEWNVDPKRLGVIGFSAGGNLCAKASNLFDKQTYAALDANDQQSCRPDFAVLVYPAYLEQDGKIANDLNLAADIPATLIVHSEDDQRFIQGSKIYAAALTETNHINHFLFYQSGGHGYGLHCELEARVWPQDTENWLRNMGIIR
jgi:lysophospholipase L1-like esterase/predicted esterase